MNGERSKRMRVEVSRREREREKVPAWNCDDRRVVKRLVSFAGERRIPRMDDQRKGFSDFFSEHLLDKSDGQYRGLSQKGIDYR